MNCPDIELSDIRCWCDPLDITYRNKDGSYLIYRAKEVKKIIGENQTQIWLQDPKDGEGIFIKFKKGKNYFIKKILFSAMEKLT